MLLPALALALAVPAAQRAPAPGVKVPRLAVKRIVWLPTTASYASTVPSLSPEGACTGMDLGLTGVKSPYLPVKRADVQAAVKANGLKTATGGSPVGSEENWSPEGALKIAMQFKADQYGMVKVTQAFRQDDATGKYIEVRALVSLYDANGKTLFENVSLRARDKTSNPHAREAAFAIGKTVVPDWYKSHVGKAK